MGERESRGPQPLLIIIDGQKEWSSQALIGRPVNEVLVARLYCTLNTSRQEKEEKKKIQTGNITRAHLRTSMYSAGPAAAHAPTVRPFVVFSSACVCTRFLINVPVCPATGAPNKDRWAGARAGPR